MERVLSPEEWQQMKQAEVLGEVQELQAKLAQCDATIATLRLALERILNVHSHQSQGDQVIARDIIAREALASAACPAPDAMLSSEPDDERYKIVRQLRFDKSTLQSELTAARTKLDQCQRERDMLHSERDEWRRTAEGYNQEVQVEIGFKLQAREDLEKCQRSAAALRRGLEDLASAVEAFYRGDDTPQVAGIALRYAYDAVQNALATDAGHSYVPKASVEPLVKLVKHFASRGFVAAQQFLREWEGL